MKEPMKNKMKIIAMLVAISSIAVGCGKTKRAPASGEAIPNTAGSTSSVSASVVTPVVPPTPAAVPAVAASAALTYETGNMYGSNSVYTTPAITTDGVLKVKFQMGNYLGNIFWQTHQLQVQVEVNGQIITPTYSASNTTYTYGYNGPGSTDADKISLVMDFSASLTPGQPVQIKIMNPMYDWYCTYPYNNPEYQTSGCRKPVFTNTTTSTNSHIWSGKLTVQTSSTVAI